MKKILVIFILLIAFIANPCFSQAPNSNASSKENKVLSNLWNSFKSTSSSAFSLEKYENWEIIAYTGITAHFIFGNDYEMHEEFTVEKDYRPFGIPKILGKIGDAYDKPGPIYATLGLAGIMYGAGKISNSHKLVETTNLMTQSLIISGVFTTLLKALIGRARPYTNHGPLYYKPFNYKFNANYMSMPSGHTSSVFALMTVIAKQYDTWYIKIPAYTFAVSVAFQRVEANKHWGSDLIIGGTLGYLIGATIVKQAKSGTRPYSIQPTIGMNGIGLSVMF